MAGASEDTGYYGLSMYFQKTKIISNQQNKLDCPGKVKFVNRLKDDLTSLGKLFNNANPLKRLVQGKDVCTTNYGFGDALGSGFGSSWEDQGGQNEHRKGTWGNNMSGESSNLCK